VGSHGPRDEPAGDAGEPRVTADAEDTAEPKGRCLVDEEAASAQDDEIAPRKPCARVLEKSRGQQARGATAGSDAPKHAAVGPQQRDLPVGPLDDDPPAVDGGRLASVGSAHDERLAPSLQAPEPRAAGRRRALEQIRGEDEQAAPASDPARQRPGLVGVGAPAREREAAPAAQRQDADLAYE